jgi:hypothetical protein
MVSVGVFSNRLCTDKALMLRIAQGRIELAAQAEARA